MASGVEEMDYENQDQPKGSSQKLLQAAILTLSMKWLDKSKKKTDLQKTLQVWFSKLEHKKDCTLQEILPDERAVIKVSPPPEITELEKLSGETLYKKDKNSAKKSVKELVSILSVMVGKPKQDPQTAEDASVNPTPSAVSVNTNDAVSEPPADKAHVDKQKKPDSTAGDTPAENQTMDESCVLSVNHFLYVTHIYKDKIQRILDENKVEIKTEVVVNFESKRKDGKPNEAKTKFTDAVLDCLSDSHGSVFSPSSADPDQLNRALKVIMNKENKLLANMSSEEMMVFGPSVQRKVLESMLKPSHKTSSGHEESQRWASSSNFSGDLLVDINMTIKDDLADEGLTIDKDQWKSLKSSYDNHLSVIKAKFNVDFKESSISEDKVNVKLSYKGHGGNPAMESHAVRALLRLYQKMMTSSVSLPPPYRADNVLPRKLGNPFTLTVATLPTIKVKGPAEESCLLPLNLFWYMSHIYKEGIKQIERKNNIKMVAQVHVAFEAEQEDGNPHEALSEFIDLSQIYSADSGEAVIPLKFVDPDQWSDALKVIKRNKDKILLTMSSEEVIVSGPKQSQDEFSAVLNAMQKTNTPADQHKPTSDGTSLRRINMIDKNPGLLLHNFSDDLSMKINMTIKDNLADEGLTIDKDQWKSLKSSYDNHLTVIKAKFNVDFKESSISEGKVNVKPSYKGRGGNPAMESDAVRALLRLYPKMMTSPVPLLPPYRATRLSGYEDSFSGAGVNGHSTQNNKESAGEGATGDSKDDQCPICLSDFTNKKQLKCKHSFCEECLQSAMKTCGPICPICKDVFGVMKGNQPDGNMAWNKYPQPLPGFPHCGHICITYNIPGGKQKENHPKPGQYYGGATRTAYLPDNKEGNEVLLLLKKAFDQKLIFTVGTSRTSGAENMVTWNDIHHKTSIHGGPECYGYPDENYLSRVKEELKAKGIQ